MFGPSGHQAPPEGGVVSNYIERATDPLQNITFKYLVDPCSLTSMRVHSVETNHTTWTWNDRGTRTRIKNRQRASFYSADFLQLNHYYTRSIEELEAKISRGPNLDAKRAAYGRKVMRTVARIAKDTVEDRTAQKFLERASA